MATTTDYGQDYAQFQDVLLKSDIKLVDEMNKTFVQCNLCYKPLPFGETKCDHRMSGGMPFWSVPMNNEVATKKRKFWLYVILGLAILELGYCVGEAVSGLVGRL